MTKPKPANRCAMPLMLWAFLLTGCSDGSDSQPSLPIDDIAMNQVQYLGTHNSYHIAPRDGLFDLLLGFVSDVAPTLDYTHIPLQEQFDTQGIRQIELDIFDDPEGGLYANRPALAVLGEDPASGIPELYEPGLKVLHVQDVDYETTCYTFVTCLTEIKDWSDANLGHLPIMVLVEAKDEEIPDPGLGFVIPLPFGADALNRIDEEIRSVFPPEQLLVPDDVRGDFATLEAAILTEGWPRLSEARGRIMFALDNGGDTRDKYIVGHTSLAGRVLFTDSPVGTPEAAFMKRNDPLGGNPGEIESLVKQGYMVRTRADADTVQARSGDTTQRDAALASGAHFISTDYPVPDPRFSDYQVRLYGDGIARCNPVSPGNCDPAFLEETM